MSIIFRTQYVFTTQRYASVLLAVVMCLSVCPSVTSRYCIKTATYRITQATPHDSIGTLEFSNAKNLFEIRTGSPPTGAPSKCGVG